MQILTTNNKRFQITITKIALSNIYRLNNSKYFSFVTFTKHLYSCKSKRINKNKDNNKRFVLVTSTKRLSDFKNKHISKNNKKSNSKSQTATLPPAISTKCLAKRKTAHIAVYSNLNKKTKMPTPAKTT